MLELVLLIVGLLTSSAVGIFVFSRNPGNIVNRIYAFMTIAMLSFTLANYLSLNTDSRLFYIRVVMFFTSLMFPSLYFLVWYIGNPNSRLTKAQIIGLCITALVALISPTGLLFKGLTEGANPVPIPNFGAGLFLINLVSFLSASSLLLIKRARIEKGIKRSQSRLMLIGISPLATLTPITGFIMPVVLENPSLVFLGPVYATFFVSMIGYAIVRHRLFDIRPVVARTVTYILVLGLFVLLYAVVGFVVLRNIFDLEFSVEAQLFFFAFLVLIAIMYQPVKKFFDRASNKLFYRDAYDPEAVIDQLNRTMVSNSDLENLLRETAAIIQSQIKTSFCVFYVKKTTYKGARIIGTGKVARDFSHLHDLKNYSGSLRDKIIVTDNVAHLQRDKLFIGLLRANEIEIMARLVDKVELNKDSSGYMLLGPKKSGSPYTSQDLKILETIVNGIVVAVENVLNYEEIDQFNVTLTKKVEEATRELKQTNDKLKALDEAKDEFVSMASHQLRTPLTSVKGYVSMVMDGDAGKVTDKQHKMLGQALTSSQRMVYLISDLLNVSRLRTGKFIIEPKPTYLPEVIATEMEQLKEEATNKDVTLAYEKPKSFPTLNLDEVKIRQVIMNLIDNALYYTKSGGKVTIHLKEKHDSIECTVTDTGIGVPKAEQHKLFTKFFRAQNARHARPDGTGLGLFMVKKVVVAQGGSIIFSSEENKGSTFGFSFSKKKLEVPPEHPKHAEASKKPERT